MKFKLSRTILNYEHCIIEAEDFDDALELWNEDPESLEGEWQDSGLGADERLTAIASLNEEGDEIVEDRDVDESGKFTE